jgi:hypothetical protein
MLIALLPAVPGQQWSWRETAAELMAYGHRVAIVTDPPEGSSDNELDLAGAWVAHCALALATHDDRPPMLLVAPGSAGRMLPALGFAQRASRRRVAGYVLVDADLPRPGVQDWPDAPVTYVGGPGAEQARLRGWDVESGGDVARAIRVVAQRWA